MCLCRGGGGGGEGEREIKEVKYCVYADNVCIVNKWREKKE